MKTWTTPVMQELDVMLTASSGDPGVTEQAGYQDPSVPSGFVWAKYDSSMYEKETETSTCVVPITNSVCATSES